MIEFPLSYRCQHNVADRYGQQCALSKEHTGPHKTEGQLTEERNRNLYPTLEDIRRVVREEIRAALEVSDEP